MNIISRRSTLASALGIIGVSQTPKIAAAAEAKLQAIAPAAAPVRRQSPISAPVPENPDYELARIHEREMNLVIELADVVGRRQEIMEEISLRRGQGRFGIVAPIPG